MDDHVDQPPFDPRYACEVYVHVLDSRRFLLVCEKQPNQTIFTPTNAWRFLASGFQPPDQSKPWLKLNGQHQFWTQ